MSLEYDFFGTRASFTGPQAVVVRAMSNGYVELFSRNIRLQLERDELADRLRFAESELQEMQKFIDGSIRSLDPDAR